MTQVSIVKELEERAGIGRTTAKNRIRTVKQQMGVSTQTYPDEVRAQILHFAISGETPPRVEVKPVTDDEWKDYLQAARTNAAGYTAAYYRSIHDFKESCEAKGTGSTFSSRVTDWLGISESYGRKLAAIGGSIVVRTTNAGRVPASTESQYLLASMGKERAQALIDSGEAATLTQAKLKQMKRPKPTPVTPTQSPQEPAGEVAADAMPDGEYVLGTDNQAKPKPKRKTKKQVAEEQAAAFTSLQDDGSDSIKEAFEEKGLEPDYDRIPGIHQMMAIQLDKRLDGLNATQKRVVRAYIKGEVEQQVSVGVSEAVAEKRRQLRDAIEKYGDKIDGAKEDIRRIRGCLHPDRPERTRVQLNNALQAFQRLLGEAS